MARGSKKPSAKEARAAKVEVQEPSDPPLKVNLYDSGALKSHLDDYARQIILDSGYDEEMYISHVKLCLGVAAILTALYAQFGPGKFPANWWTVLGCVILYIVLSLVLNWFVSKFEGDAFLVSKPRTAADGGLKLSSHMNRYALDYTLVITDRRDAKRYVELPTLVTKYFHSDGYMADEAFRDDVLQLLGNFEGLIKGAVVKKTQ